jgi:prepilin peptidase CpaA
MNLIVGSPLWLIAILFLALAGAAIEDTIRFRISNRICGAVLVAALVAMGIHGFSPTLWQNAVVCIAVLALGTAAFAAGWLGGGDVKFLAAVGLWLNLRAAVGLIAAVFIAGGLLALVYVTARMVQRGGSLRGGNRRIPYGIAITVGAVFIFVTQLNQRPSNPFIERLRTQEAAQR